MRWIQRKKGCDPRESRPISAIPRSAGIEREWVSRWVTSSKPWKKPCARSK